MKRYFVVISSLLLLVTALPTAASLEVFACEPEWAALVTELGGDNIEVYTATTALQDPHHIQARPSLIAKVRRAELVICSGSALEIGWLPMLLRQAGNPAVMPGKPGNFEASSLVERLEVPEVLDRSLGDIHASGNPHIHLDPHRLLQIATALNQRLVEINPTGAVYYQQRLGDFTTRWQQAITRWERRAAPLREMRVVVHHKDWVYLFDWLGINTVGALEPKPGLPTTVSHLAVLKRTVAQNGVSLIVHTAYQSDRAARRLSQMSGIPVVELPYTVGGAMGADNLFSLFDITLERLLETGP